MLSRAHLIIQRDYENLIKTAPWGITAQPISDENIFEWVAKIQGTKNSIWENGIFRVYIKFDENYNKRPPTVCFHTIPYHPNVDMITGKPSLEIIDDYTQWKQSYTIIDILKQIQALLSKPNFSELVNPDAASMIAHNPEAYKQMVHECVTNSQKVNAAISPTQLIKPVESKVKFILSDTQQSTHHRKVPSYINKISFEDYHKTWSGIATSKTAQDGNNPFLDDIKASTSLLQAHIGIPEEEIEDQMKRQVDEHNTLMYGRFKTKKSPEDEKALKIAKLNKMKKIYLPPRTPQHSEAPQGSRDEPWEREVDDLVAWSSKLDMTVVDA